MVKKCCIKSCKSESYGGCGISFHSFPSVEELKKKWLDVIPTTQKITKNSVVCSLHFKSTDFNNNANIARRLLNATAVPSIFSIVLSKNNVNEDVFVQRDSKPCEFVTHLTHSVSRRQILEVSSHSQAQRSSRSTNSLGPPSAKKFCLRFNDVAVQTDMYKHSNTDINDLKREVKILLLRLNRREYKLKNLESILAILQKPKHSYGEIE